MTWTAPATAVTGNTLTAAFWNAQVRDNMLETAAATAIAAGDIVYADAANSMGSRVALGSANSLLASTGSALSWRKPTEDVDYANGATSGVTSRTTFGDGTGVSEPGTAYPAVTVTTGTLAIVFVSAFGVSNSTGGATVRFSYSVSGASTVVASTERGAQFQSDSADQTGQITLVKVVSLTAGSNTFQMEANVSAGAGTIIRPRILVIPL